MTATELCPADLRRQLPTLSVVVPNYNHARYLEAALHAHLDQSVPPLEIIVVDDASTDDSCAVIERVAAQHPSVRLVRLARNGGVNATINVGLRKACGDYVCVSAADDLVTREFAALSLQVLAQYPTAGFGFSDPAELVGDSGVVQQLPLRLSSQPCMLSPRDIERLLKGNYFSFPGHAVIYRRAALLALGGYVEDLRWYADWFANCVLAFRYGACYVPQILAFCRVSPSSYSARGLRDTQVQRELVYRVLDLLECRKLQDVAGPFRVCALVPELRARVLPWLLTSPRHRRYVTPRLVVRLSVRGLWWMVKPYMPDWVRPTMRWLARRWAQMLTIGKGET